MRLCVFAFDFVITSQGDNKKNILGLGSDASQAVGVVDVPADHAAVRVDATERAVDISCGGVFTCAVTSGGRVRCWGRQMFGELGVGPTIVGLNSPVSDSPAVGLAAGTVVQVRAHLQANVPSPAISCAR